MYNICCYETTAKYGSFSVERSLMGEKYREGRKDFKGRETIG